MIVWWIGRFPKAIISRHTFAFEQTRGHKSSAVLFFSLSRRRFHLARFQRGIEREN